MKKLKSSKILNSKQQKIVQGGLWALEGTPAYVEGNPVLTSSNPSGNPFGVDCYCNGMYMGRFNNPSMCISICP